MSHRIRLSKLLLVLFVLLLQGCSLAPEREEIPGEQLETARVAAIDRARYWGDEPQFLIDEEWFQLAESDYRATYPKAFGRSHHYLAISGGGAKGAFGAGLLNGWSAAGTRPEFTIVTGISTGALSAPFAFLGSEYDPVLREIYTSYSTDDLLIKRSLLTVFTRSSVMDSAPLRQKISEYITPKVMEKIAAEGRKGRRLLVGTVNLDVARPVTWDITVIAGSGRPEALDLIHDVILASASIPPIFPPVFIDVEAENGERFQEMHVDGGAANQVFLYPAGLDWERVLQQLKVPEKPKVYLIRNSKLFADAVTVKPSASAITRRAISSLIRTQGIGDMYRIYLNAMRDQLDYHLAVIPEEFNVSSTQMFDLDYMNALYDLGYSLAVQGYPWMEAPPGLIDNR
jgi:predicted acylesterase/phospholipase RssA